MKIAKDIKVGQQYAYNVRGGWGPSIVKILTIKRETPARFVSEPYQWNKKDGRPFGNSPTLYEVDADVLARVREQKARAWFENLKSRSDLTVDQIEAIKSVLTKPTPEAIAP